MEPRQCQNSPQSRKPYDGNENRDGWRSTLVCGRMALSPCDWSCPTRGQKSKRLAVTPVGMAIPSRIGSDRPSCGTACMPSHPGQPLAADRVSRPYAHTWGKDTWGPDASEPLRPLSAKGGRRWDSDGLRPQGSSSKVSGMKEDLQSFGHRPRCNSRPVVSHLISGDPCELPPNDSFRISLVSSVSFFNLPPLAVKLAV